MSEQCLGITKSGTRCKISSNLVDGYCRLHRKQSEKQPESSVTKAQSKPEMVAPVSDTAPENTQAPPPFEEPQGGPELPFDSDHDSAALKKLFTLIGIVLVIAAFIFKRKRR